MGSTIRKSDPYLGFRFSIEINGIVSGGFAECSGLQVETEVEEYREGGVNEYVHKLSKGTKYQNITLKRGITDHDDMWKWHLDVTMGRIRSAMKDVFIILWNNEGQEKWRWHCEGAYPIKWSGPELKADGSAVATEAVELAHTGIRKI